MRELLLCEILKDRYRVYAYKELMHAQELLILLYLRINSLP